MSSIILPFSAKKYKKDSYVAKCKKRRPLSSHVWLAMTVIFKYGLFLLGGGHTILENHRRQHIAENGLIPPIFRSVVDVIF